jgi:hypothetical protein
MNRKIVAGRPGDRRWLPPWPPARRWPPRRGPPAHLSACGWRCTPARRTSGAVTTTARRSTGPRVCGTWGTGSQVLLSEAVATLIRDDLPAGWDLAELGEHTLRGLTRPERVFALIPSGATLGRDATVVARKLPLHGTVAIQDRGRPAVLRPARGRGRHARTPRSRLVPRAGGGVGERQVVAAAGRTRRPAATGPRPRA